MSDDNDDNKVTVELPVDKNVRNEMISLLRSGTIDYNYKMNTNFFTAEANQHNQIIDNWRSEYGNTDNEKKFDLMKIALKKNSLKNQHVVNLTIGERGKKVVVLLLCYEKSDDDINYGSISGTVWLRSSDSKALDKIRGHPEELAAAIFSKSNSEFEIKCVRN